MSIPSSSRRRALVCALVLVSLGSSAGLGAEPMTAARQKALTPQAVLDELMAGNERFVKGRSTRRDLPAEVRATAAGQYPKAAVLSCLDSRVPVEWVFDQGLGDLFVARVAGNVEDTAVLGSLEFATRAAGAKLVLVLGHSACGAVKGAIDRVELGSLTDLLREIEPAVEAAGPVARRSSKDAALVERVVAENVRRTLADLRARSAILRELEASGQLRIAGALYDLSDGRVRLLP